MPPAAAMKCRSPPRGPASGYGAEALPRVSARSTVCRASSVPAEGRPPPWSLPQDADKLRVFERATDSAAVTEMVGRNITKNRVLHKNNHYGASTSVQKEELYDQGTIGTGYF
ncbi:spermatogenesis associated 6-like protein isoform X9 [Strix uralensis]|uniref:spermatogenesis associated 6-like protein isoform X9 n=1 Tax=Strix uralensis TaxID=36305 RepID=UPI003DA6D72B